MRVDVQSTEHRMNSYAYACMPMRNGHVRFNCVPPLCEETPLHHWASQTQSFLVADVLMPHPHYAILV